MCHDFYEEPFIWYLIKCLLKVQVDEVHCFVVTSVICVNDTGKELKKACLAAALVSEDMLRVTYQVVAFKVCDYLSFSAILLGLHRSPSKNSVIRTIL